MVAQGTVAASPKHVTALSTPHQWTDKLGYEGKSWQFRWLIKALDELQDGQGRDGAYGFNLESCEIWGRTAADLARMRRVVALLVKLLGDMDGGFENLASDEHLCVSCEPQDWDPHALTGDVPLELKHSRSCQLLGHVSALNISESTEARGRCVVDLRQTMGNPEGIIEQVRATLRGLRTVQRYEVMDELEEHLKQHRSWGGLLKKCDELLDVTWITSEGFREGGY